MKSVIQYVWLLEHTHTHSDGSDDVKILGLFSTRAKARSALLRAKQLPGFSDAKRGFHIWKYSLDEDHWAEGYATLTWRE